MKKNYLLFACLFFGSAVAFSQYCIPDITNNCTTDAPETINSVTLESIDNPTGCSTGVNDYTGMVANLIIGETYELTVDITADAGFPDDYVLMYIDWNQDTILNDPGEFYHIAGPTGDSGPVSFNLTVPNDAMEGETRMRILINWNQPTHDGCELMNYGEIEDYTINVGVIGMEENTIVGFSYSPNPLEDYLNIKAAVNIDAVSVFNLMGQKVISQELAANSGQLDLRQLEAGVYLMQVKSEGNTAVFQVIKK